MDAVKQLVRLEKIGEGASSNVYRGLYNGQESALKYYDKQHPEHFKHKFLLLGDRCEREYSKLQKVSSIASPHRANLQEPIDLVKDGDVSVLVSSLIKNCDGSVSKGLQHYDSITPSFYRELRGVIQSLAEISLWLRDLSMENTLVMENGENMHPVIIDFEKVGADYYPFQRIASLFDKKYLENKFRRKANRFLSSVERMVR